MSSSAHQQQPQPEGADAHDGSDEFYHHGGRRSHTGAAGHNPNKPHTCTQGESAVTPLHAVTYCMITFSALN